MATYTDNLTKFYGGFFIKAFDLALSPYMLTLSAFAKDRRNMGVEEFACGVAACVALTVVVPVLPEITSLTFFIAGIGMGFALASMFFSYPVAWLCDAIDTNSYSCRDLYAY